jgi:cofilin
LRNTHRYIVFKIENAKEIKIEKKGETTASYDEFLKQLPDNDCRYAVYNFEYNQADGFRSKIVFFLW